MENGLISFLWMLLDHLVWSPAGTTTISTRYCLFIFCNSAVSHFSTFLQIGVHNQLTYNSLTKQVTFTPYYILINNAPFTIECQEFDRPADSWKRVEPKSCTALWPKSERDDKLLKLKIEDTEEISAPFLFTESHTTLLKLKNKVSFLFAIIAFVF